MKRITYKVSVSYGNTYSCCFNFLICAFNSDTSSAMWLLSGVIVVREVDWVFSFCVGNAFWRLAETHLLAKSSRWCTSSLKCNATLLFEAWNYQRYNNSPISNNELISVNLHTSDGWQEEYNTDWFVLGCAPPLMQVCLYHRSKHVLDYCKPFKNRSIAIKLVQM